MKKLIVVAVVMIIAGNRSYSHYTTCEDWPSVPQVITVENVGKICEMEADPGGIIEARWHKTEPILVTLALSGEDAAEPFSPYIVVWDVEGGLAHIEFEVKDAISRSFTQLELTSSSIIVGTNTGSIKSFGLLPQEHEFDPPILQYELPIIDGEVTELLLHPGGEWLLVVIDYLRLFKVNIKLQTVSEIHLQDSKDFKLQALTFSNDGRLLAVAGTEAMRIWDTAGWAARYKASLSGEAPASLHFTNSNSDLVLLAGKSVSRWSFADGNLQFVHKLSPQRHIPECVLLGGDINPEGNLLMTTDKCGLLRAWNLELAQELAMRHVLRPVSDDHIGVPTRFSPDGRFLVDREGKSFFRIVTVEKRY